MLSRQVGTENITSSELRHILVVEDDPEFGSIIVQWIRDETPYSAILATNGVEALNIAEHMQCDLFLLDYQLPLMNGLELYDRLRAMEYYKETPVLFLSASSYLPAHELNLRNILFVSKLIELDDLLQKIRGLLESDSQ